MTSYMVKGVHIMLKPVEITFLRWLDEKKEVVTLSYSTQEPVLTILLLTFTSLVHCISFH